MRARLSRSLTTISCLTISACAGCNGLTLGPTTKVEYVIVYPGQPVQVMENETVRVRTLSSNSVGKHDIGGWVAMPREHFEALSRAAGLEEK